MLQAGPINGYCSQIPKLQRPVSDEFLNRTFFSPVKNPSLSTTDEIFCGKCRLHFSLNKKKVVYENSNTFLILTIYMEGSARTWPFYKLIFNPY